MSMLNASHTLLFATLPVATAGILAGLSRPRQNIDQLTAQIDETLAHTLHRLVANGASEWELARAVGGFWGVLRLLRQAGIHVSIIVALAQQTDEVAKARVDLEETHFLALWEALVASRDSLTRPALRRVVECFCLMTRESDTLLNDRDARVTS